MMAERSNDGKHCDKHFRAPENLKFYQISQILNCENKIYDDRIFIHHSLKGL